MGGHHGRQAALQTARRADADQMTHGEPEVEATRMSQDARQDVRVPAEERATHGSRVIAIRRTSVRTTRHVDAAGAVRVIHESGDDWQHLSERDPQRPLEKVAVVTARHGIDWAATG